MVMYITFPFPLSLVAFAPFYEVECIPRMGEPYDRRVARPSISPRAYRRLTLGALLLLAAIVVSGAAVRLTG